MSWLLMVLIVWVLFDLLFMYGFLYHMGWHRGFDECDKIDDRMR